jgi:hypothetical protein
VRRGHRQGARAELQIPVNRVTRAGGLLPLQGTQVVLVRRLSGMGCPAWVVDPPQAATLQEAAATDAGTPLPAGTVLPFPGLPEAWLQVLSNRWRPQDLDFLRQQYGQLPASVLADQLGRKSWAVHEKARALGLGRHRMVWTPELDEMLALLYPDTAAGAIAALLGASTAAVYQRAGSLGLEKAEGFAAAASRAANLARSPFTPEIQAAIRERYPNTRTEDLARELGLKLGSVHRWAAKHGIKKLPELVVQMARDRFGPDHPARKTGFPKGHVPANKGRKGISYPGMEATQFKKGTRPHTWRPIGTFTVDSDGYAKQKVTETGYPPRDWQFVHRLVWEAAHGPIPPGHLVRFREDMKTSDPALITVDRLECISMAENARRNAWHTNFPPELKELVSARIQLKRAITKKSKELEQGS